MAADEQDKQHEPSQKKLDDQRKKGNLPRSQDLSGAIAYAGMLLSLAVAGPWVVGHFGTLGLGILAATSHPGGHLAADGMPFPPGVFGASLAQGILVLLIPPGVLVLASLMAQRTLVFAPGKLAPKLSRISPRANASNKFGRSGLFEFGKSLAKLTIISTVLAAFLLRNTDRIAAAMSASPGGVGQLMARLALEFLAILVVVFGIIGVVDLLWQHSEHRRRNRMSHKELQDETKESEGDPHMKAARRRRAQEIALNSMLADVSEASVVIVNPEHYAVALKWDATYTGPPVCVAKGVDEIAARIREAAIAAGVPIRPDPPTARAIYAATEIGQEIHPDQYGAVAAAIRFAERMREIARRRVLD